MTTTPRATTSDDAGQDRWTCRWLCGYKHPVATLVQDHERTCVARPVREVA